MTPTETASLLRYIGTVDDRFTFTDQNMAAARVRAWAGILEGVDGGWASEHVKRFYSKPGQPKITPSEIRASWHGHQRREDALTRPQQACGDGPPPGMMDYLRDVVKAVKAGQDPDSVPRPPSVELTPDQDRASRKCRNWRGCACDHTICRDGWLDQEERIVNGLGKSYPAVKACPHCRDAALMAVELATPVRRRR